MKTLWDLPLPTEPDRYAVFSMCYGSGETRRVRDNFIFTDLHDGPMPLDYNLWIVANRTRTFLVDTGFGPRASVERGRPIAFDPVAGLAQIGVDPNIVEDIVVTHLHYDHAGNIDRFGNARLHVQNTEVAFATGRCMCDSFTRYPFDVEDIVTLVRRTYAEFVTFHEGDDSLFPGVSLHALPGHSAMVQGVRVMTPRGPILLASDASHYYANFLLRAPFVLTVDVPDTLDSYDRMLQIAGSPDRIIPGHDPKVRRIYPSIEVNGIVLHALHETPTVSNADSLARTDDY
jgi:glyoxylase-like metal-dependent hydrolase (beta-lactamase superfamily II)